MVDQEHVGIGQALRWARAEALLSVEQVGARMLPPVSAAAVESWEAGVCPPTGREVEDYCRVVGVAPNAAAVLEFRWVQVISAPLLARPEIPALAPLSEWAAAHGAELIRLTPATVAEAARMCGVRPVWLRRRLLKVQRRAGRDWLAGVEAFWLVCLRRPREQDDGLLRDT